MKYKNKMLFIFLSLISVILTLNIDPSNYFDKKKMICYKETGFFLAKF